MTEEKLHKIGQYIMDNVTIRKRWTYVIRKGTLKLIKRDKHYTLLSRKEIDIIDKLLKDKGMKIYYLTNENNSIEITTKQVKE